ncbi:hypothetical protein PP707_08325 [Acetobacter pasteurianus]|nr:hypothetical protein [Acetobacter pasteurianus]
MVATGSKYCLLFPFPPTLPPPPPHHHLHFHLLFPELTLKISQQF